ncbi:hypothetical protein ACJ73_04991 [Blastomyces percursus]|uniref:Uncharacterized protein n=1 Tax=Blastomyces percursus TaxID=1658174 RepID=A0A1J9Q6E6_9EURO|nr:hypothetical protein ACJ73_04991 [Blastomyces percursus]
MGSLHTLRDKVELKLIDNENLVRLSREGLLKSGTVVVRLTARWVVPGKGDLMGIRIAMDSDKSPACDPDTDPFCDGGVYNGYDVEVIDRMGPDSFTPDSGMMISKIKAESRGTYQWTIDANPQDLRVVDFYIPDGTPAMVSLGDYCQLADALFHAGTRSGSEYEYVDKANGLHFYIIDIQRDRKGILSYTVAVRPLDKKDSHRRGVKINRGQVKPMRGNKPTYKGVTCSFKLRNTGSYSPASGGKQQHSQDISEDLKSDVEQWTTVDVAVAADKWATYDAEVKLTATSESDSSVVESAVCRVRKYMY